MKNVAKITYIQDEYMKELCGGVAVTKQKIYVTFLDPVNNTYYYTVVHSMKAANKLVALDPNQVEISSLNAITGSGDIKEKHKDFKNLIKASL